MTGRGLDATTEKRGMGIMKFVTVLLLLALVLAAPFAYAERIVRSGSTVVDLDTIDRESDNTVVMTRDNILQNPGFETGTLPPWTTNNWEVTGADAASGDYCAEDIGNYWVRQDFDPIDVADIASIVVWSKQPEEAISAIDFYYSESDYDEFIIFPLADWAAFDVTGELRSVGNLVAIRIWGYSGGGPDPDLTRVDDILIDAPPVATDEATWGSVKNLYR
jgi:hypothetical protein